MKYCAAAFLLCASVRAVSVSNYADIDYQQHWVENHPAPGAALLQANSGDVADDRRGLRAKGTTSDADETTASTASNVLGPLGEAVLGPFGGIFDIATSSISSWRKSLNAASEYEHTGRIADDPKYTVSLNTEDPHRTMEARNLGPSLADRIVPILVIVILIVAGIAANSYVRRIAKLDKENHLNETGEEEQVQMEVGIDHDVYGASIYSIIHDGWDIVSNTDHDNIWMSSNVYHLCLVMSFLIMNYIMQLSLLSLTYTYVVTARINRVQESYTNFQRDCFTASGMINQTAWDDESTLCGAGKDDVCGIIFFSNFGFTYLILVLWCGTMLKEWRHNERMYRNIRDIPAPEDFEDDIIETYRDETEQQVQRVVRLGPLLRALIYSVVVIPKFGISLILLVSGIQWLSCSRDVTFLVLNSVSLIFIVHIDELLYEALMAASTHRGIENFKLYPLKAKDRNVDTMYGYFRSTGFLIAMLFIPYLYLTIGQEVPELGIFPQYDRDLIYSLCKPIWESAATAQDPDWKR